MLRTHYTAELRIEANDEIDQESSRVLMYSQTRHFYLAKLGIESTADAIGLKSSAYKTHQNTLRLCLDFIQPV